MRSATLSFLFARLLLSACATSRQVESASSAPQERTSPHPERIEVLKGPETALHGVQESGGVLLITTKRGRRS